MIKIGRKEDPIENEINEVILCMKGESPDTKEYTAMANNVGTLMEARGQLPPNVISKNTLVTGAVSLISILAILKFEKLDHITSKAIGFILKGRV